MEKEEFREYLEVCTDSEADWKDFLSICSIAFQNSAPFKRSHPNPEKRGRFVAAYFNYLYETQLSGGRAGLACLKRKLGDREPEIVYGLVGIYPCSSKCAGNKTDMERIDKHGMDVALREDEWSQRYVSDRIADFSKIHACTHINYALQVAKYADQGTGTRCMMAAAEAIGFDGRKKGKVPHLPVVAYAIVDEAKARRFYRAIGMTEIAHLHAKEDQSSTYRCVDDFSEKTDGLCDCIFVMYTGYPQPKFLEHELRNLFS